VGMLAVFHCATSEEGGYYQYTSLGYFEFSNTTYNHTYSDMDGITAFISELESTFFSEDDRL
jgi:hypothetical protein